MYLLPEIPSKRLPAARYPVLGTYYETAWGYQFSSLLAEGLCDADVCTQKKKLEAKVNFRSKRKKEKRKKKERNSSFTFLMPPETDRVS